MPGFSSVINRNRSYAFTRFPRGLDRLTPTWQLPPDALAQCKGVEVMANGQLRTELAYANFPSYANLPGTGWRPAAGHAFSAGAATGTGAGYYYLALHAPSPTSKVRVYRIRRDATGNWAQMHFKDAAANDYSELTGIPAKDMKFATFFNTVFFCTPQAGLWYDTAVDGPGGDETQAVPDETPSDFWGSVCDDAGTPLQPRYIAAHLDFLFCVVVGSDSDYCRLQWSFPGQAWGTTAGTSHFNALDWVEVGAGSGNGIHALVSTRKYMYIFKGTSIWVFAGDNIKNYSIECINTRIGTISHHTVWRSSVDDSLYFLDKDNDLYRIVGYSVRKVSSQVDRERYVGSEYLFPGGDALYDHYRIGPVSPYPSTYAQTEGQRGGSQAEGAVGYTLAVPNGALNQSREWRYLDPAYEFVTWIDQNFNRVFRAGVPSGTFSDKYIRYLDYSQIQTARVKTSDASFDVIASGDFDFGNPSTTKRLNDIWVENHPTVSSQTVPYYHLYVRFDMGSWQEVYIDDREKEVLGWTNTYFPLDGLMHRGAGFGGMTWNRLAWKIEFDNESGPAGGQGMHSPIVKVDFSEELL